VVGTAKLCAEELKWRLSPTLRRAEAQRRAADEAFDQAYGVETGGVFRAKADEVVGGNWALGGNYQAVAPSIFSEALEAVRIPHDEFTFIDFGSGKGRALILASHFPFKKVVGVEYCPALNAVARENASRIPPDKQRCGAIEVVDADAAEYRLPEEPLVLFLYHPFAEPVMRRVVGNVADSLRARPRRIIVIYLLPHHDYLWEETGRFKRLQISPAIFDTK
jgi:SAM-dependent methyltransferase